MGERLQLGGGCDRLRRRFVHPPIVRHRLDCSGSRRRKLPGMSDPVVFVEIPSGSRNKYEFDPELGAIVLDRRLFTR